MALAEDDAARAHAYVFENTPVIQRLPAVGTPTGATQGPAIVPETFRPSPTAAESWQNAPLSSKQDDVPTHVVEMIEENGSDAATTSEAAEVADEKTIGLDEDEVEEEEEVEWLDPRWYLIWATTGWDGSVEMGFDGTDGNTQALNFRLGCDLKRELERHVLEFDFDYRKKTTDGEETANRALMDWRLERLFGKSPFSAFVHGTVDYDEFKAFDARVSVDIGLGYKFIKTDTTSFAGRLGSGFSKEIGGPDDRYVPEAVFGLDFERKLNDRHKLTASAEYTPEMEGFNDFRLKTRAAWEALIDKEMNLSLKLSILNQHDSTPNGARPNDVDYSAVLLWKF